MKSDCLLYADDTSLFDVVEDPALSFFKLSDDLNSIKEWALKWLVTINPSKTKCLTFSTKRNKPSHPVLLFDGTPIEEVSQHKYLGVILIISLGSPMCFKFMRKLVRGSIC